MIDSLLDDDFYKLSMGQLVFHKFFSTRVEYEFRCRNNIKWTKAHLGMINQEIGKFVSLYFTEDEIEYLSKIEYFKKDYIDFLKTYHPNINNVHVDLLNDELKLNIQGYWANTIYWEVPLLAIISRANTIWSGNHTNSYGWFRSKFEDKLKYFNTHPFPLSDFGTRRRCNRDAQEYAISRLADNPNFLGTSNVYLAKKYKVRPIGTQAHELFMAAQATSKSLVNFQKDVLQSWLDEYNGQLSIALTDTIGIDSFLKDFDLNFAQRYSGLRHDSGDPEVWADKVLEHYKKLGIDAKTKTLVFSDGLNFEKAYSLYQKYKDVTNPIFGIGTYLTNDVPGLTPPNIVIKLVSCNNKPVAKISDSNGKCMCNDNVYVDNLKKVFNAK
ncbi:MAG: nicotinate phosphoribosyltransferase [Patescibacteria group bacterium]